MTASYLGPKSLLGIINLPDYILCSSIECVIRLYYFASIKKKSLLIFYIPAILNIPACILSFIVL